MSTWDAEPEPSASLDVLRDIKYQAEVLEGTLQSIERLLRDNADNQQAQFRQLKNDVENIRSMTNWIAGIALMFGIAFVVKACS